MKLIFGVSNCQPVDSAGECDRRRMRIPTMSRGAFFRFPNAKPLHGELARNPVDPAFAKAVDSGWMTNLHDVLGASRNSRKLPRKITCGPIDVPGNPTFDCLPHSKAMHRRPSCLDFAKRLFDMIIGSRTETADAALGVLWRRKCTFNEARRIQRLRIRFMIRKHHLQ